MKDVEASVTPMGNPEDVEKLRPINIDLAWRIRNKRGLLLPWPGNYADERVEEIAERQHILMKEFDALDEKLNRLKKGHLE